MPTVACDKASSWNPTSASPLPAGQTPFGVGNTANNSRQVGKGVEVSRRCVLVKSFVTKLIFELELCKRFVISLAEWETENSVLRGDAEPKVV